MAAHAAWLVPHEQQCMKTYVAAAGGAGQLCHGYWNLQDSTPLKLTCHVTIQEASGVPGAVAGAPAGGVTHAPRPG